MCLGVWSKSGLQHKKKQQGKGSTLINIYGIPCTLRFQYSIWMNIKRIQTVFFLAPIPLKNDKILVFSFHFSTEFQRRKLPAKQGLNSVSYNKIPECKAFKNGPCLSKLYIFNFNYQIWSISMQASQNIFTDFPSR